MTLALGRLRRNADGFPQGGAADAALEPVAPVGAVGRRPFGRPHVPARLDHVERDDKGRKRWPVLERPQIRIAAQVDRRRRGAGCRGRRIVSRRGGVRCNSARQPSRGEAGRESQELAAARQAQGSRHNGATARNHFSSKTPLPDSGLIALALKLPRGHGAVKPTAGVYAERGDILVTYFHGLVVVSEIILGFISELLTR